MLSRRLMRAIVMQALYAFFQAENDRADVAERAMLERIEKIKMLFMHQISFLIEIIRFARERTEEGKKKFIPKEEDLKPNTRLMDAKLIRQIESNIQYREGMDTFKINWAEEKDLIRKIYQNIKTGKDYEKYLKTDNTYEADREYITKFFKKYIFRNSTLKSLYEERNIFWADDYDYVNNEIIKMLSGFEENFGATHSLYKDKENFKEDIDFVKHLLRKTMVHSSEYENIISEIIKNWESERIATIDMLLMKMAVCELLNFEEIPVKVTLNEYIEIAKIYSTPKSSNFINGVLDKILEDFKKDNKIVKSGRGTIN
jgi:N utilization substance protein B